MGAALRGFPPVTQRQHRDDDRDQLVGRLHLRQLQDALLSGAADLYGQARGYVGGPTGSDFEKKMTTSTWGEGSARHGLEMST